LRKESREASSAREITPDAVHGPLNLNREISKPHPIKLSYENRCITMSKARAATDQIVKLIVGAGQASPSPPVGPALGSKGVKSMDFCKVCSSNLSSCEAIELHNIIPKPELAMKTIAKKFPRNSMLAQHI
jgi:hypothetical protein